jgi:hypothetical protein
MICVCVCQYFGISAVKITGAKTQSSKNRGKITTSPETGGMNAKAPKI